MTGKAVDLNDFGVVFFDFFDGFIRVDFLAVNGAILVRSDKHVVIPGDGGVVNFSRIV